MIRLGFVVPTLLILAVASASSSEDKFAIDLVVREGQPRVGQVLVSLFDSSEKYMQEPLVETVSDVDADGLAVLDLGRHAPGEYAIVVVYDKNGNGKLNTGLFRIPKEKIGYSNDAKSKFGPAKWDDTRFLLGDADLRIDILLKNAKHDE